MGQTVFEHLAYMGQAAFNIIEHNTLTKCKPVFNQIKTTQSLTICYIMQSSFSFHIHAHAVFNHWSSVEVFNYSNMPTSF